MTRSELLARTPASEFAELLALDRLGEIGERRADRRIARATMHIVASLRSSRSGPVRQGEFLLSAIDDPEPAEPQAADIDAQVRRFDLQAGAKWTRAGSDE